MPATPTPPPGLQTERHWREAHAFGLPEGSIRALLAVAVFATIWVLLVRRCNHEVPDYLRNLLFIIMGHYFATRRRPSLESSSGPGPLFLPRGTIRWILFGGFAAVGALLFRQGRLWDPTANPGVVTLLLVVGFLLGVVVARIGEWRKNRGHPTPRWIEDARAGVSLIAAAVLLFLVWRRMDTASFDETSFRIGRYGVEDIMSALVGFYFGSRS